MLQIRNNLTYHSAFFLILVIINLALYGTDGAAERLCIVGHHMTKIAEEEEVGIVWLDGNRYFGIAVAKQADWYALCGNSHQWLIFRKVHVSSFVFFSISQMQR